LPSLPEVVVIGEFKGFLLKTNALALAIGVIIGAALGTVVNSLVNDIIMPPIGWLLGGVDFNRLRIELPARGGQAEPVYISYGAFLNSLITFVIIALVVFWISKMFLKEAPADEVKTCPFCKEANAADASRCKACTSPI
jgi:large conductance mechanosensitive channel